MTPWVPFDLFDHLWQSTLFAAAIWVAARAVRAYRARVRYWLWFSASVKFLIPVSGLVAIGERFAWRTEPAADPFVATVIEQVLAPATASIATVPVAPIAPVTKVWPMLLLVAWGCGVVFVLVRWWRQWQPFRRALRDARPLDMHDVGLTVRVSASMIEPGVVGIWRPVLLVPDGLVDRLTPAQLRALLAHEQCHVRHHDNLTATMHMGIELLFWFHPLVWWLERRLIEERERACDEYVLQSGSSPHHYAEGILEVCRFAKAPLPVFVAGVTGSGLRRRIESILQHQVGRPLTRERVVALMVCAITAVLGPVTAGAVQSTRPVGQSLSFEVASVRLSDPKVPVSERITETRVDLIKTTLRGLLWMAFEIDPFCCRDRIPGAEPFGNVMVDVQATIPAGATRKQVPEMMRSLLIQRFGLRTHVEPRPTDGYELVVGDGGIRMKEVEAANELDKEFPPDPSVRTVSDIEGQMANGRTRIISSARGIRTITEHSMYDRTFTAPGVNQINAIRMTMPEFAALLSTNTGRPVVDRTNLTGVYAFSIELPTDAWQVSMNARAGRTTARDGTPLNEPVAVSVPRNVERLGLKLEPRRIPVDIIVIDHIERAPSPN